MKIQKDMSNMVLKLCIALVGSLLRVFAETSEFLLTSGSFQCLDRTQIIQKASRNPTLLGCYIKCQNEPSCTHIGVKSFEDISDCYLLRNSTKKDLAYKENYREAIALTTLTQGDGKELTPGRDNRPLVLDSVTLGLTDIGNWTQNLLCPINSKVTGFRIQVEPDNGQGDDTSLNGVQLACSDGSFTNPITGLYGTWQPWKLCNTDGDIIYPDMFIEDFQVSSEPPQGSGDDTGVNNIKMICNNRKELLPQSTPWGIWKDGKCPVNTYLCGIQAKTDGLAKASGVDASGVTRLKFICCC